ncbi:putative glutamine--tRNA ligase [Oratosquilla oratoria]|uniref:putative glutamine--tRNA ligase n=1 Tax=Oratosquilla oratoria TaxID=337810 RepID=UPI003F76B914
MEFGCFNGLLFEVREELLQVLLERKNGTFLTRFPPEPSGYLHIGHVKALEVNKRTAERHHGEMILRFDDTNPETITKEFYLKIEEDARWLGYEFYCITYASDSFGFIYRCAVNLIEQGNAYVCHLPSKGSGDFRIKNPKGIPSPYRNRSVEENLIEFKKMKCGYYDSSEAVLRMKLETSGGFVDPVMYRIVFTPHVRTGNEWCIYPSYDFAHCICDSVENVSVSLCTAEFTAHRPVYNWVLETLELPKVEQREFERLKVTHALTSKRKIKKLAATVVDGFDDPRLYTIAGLRRRGVPPQAVKAFVNKGFTQAAQLTSLTRETLAKAPLRFVILEPLLCKVINYNEFMSEIFPGKYPGDYRHHLIPDGIERQTLLPKGKMRTVEFTDQFYINKFDFSNEVKQKKKRVQLTPETPVRLRLLGYGVEVVKVNMDDDEVNVKSLEVRLVAGLSKWKRVIPWVSNPVCIEVTYIDELFTVERPTGATEEINHESKSTIICYAERSLQTELNFGPVESFQYGQTFQVERCGYITLDPLATPLLPKFNVTCLLNLHEDQKNKLLSIFY